MKKEDQTLNYKTAFAELQQLMTDLQSDAIGIDELAEKITRARELIQYCRERLRDTENTVGGMLEE